MRRTTLVSGLVLAAALALPATTLAADPTPEAQAAIEPVAQQTDDNELPIGLLGLGGLLGLAGLMRRDRPTNEPSRSTLDPARHT